MPHVIERKGFLQGTGLALFLAFAHTVNDGITAIFGALLPSLQERLQLGPTLLAVLVAVFWISSSVLQPVFGSLAEQASLRAIGALGVICTALFLSLIGVVEHLWLLFVLLVLGGLGSAALHPVGTAIAGRPTARNRSLGVGLFTAGGMIGFGLGPLLILALVSRHGSDATAWLILPGLLLGGLLYLVLPRFEPHPRRRLRQIFDTDLIRGPIGLLAVAGGFASVAFITFTSSVPLWLVREHGYDADAPAIGWTLGVFAFAAGFGALLGGVSASRLGRRTVIVGSLMLAAVPLLTLIQLEPGSWLFFAVVALAGILVLASGPVSVVLAQDLAPHSPATASGMILGMTSAIGGVLYIALGRLQAVIGLEASITIGFSMVIPAALLTLAVLSRSKVAAHVRSA